MLYIGLGDGGSAGDPHHNGQNLGTLLGKILRIDPDAAAAARRTRFRPTTRSSGAAGARPEIWMCGLRNPWRFSFDRATGDMWIGDVGQDVYEEIDFAPAGEKGINWGWSAREGFHAFNGGATPPGARDPILETTARRRQLRDRRRLRVPRPRDPALDGVYVFGDDCRPNLVGVVADAADTSSRNATSASPSPRSRRSARTRAASSTRSRAAARCSGSPRG